MRSVIKLTILILTLTLAVPALAADAGGAVPAPAPAADVATAASSAPEAAPDAALASATTPEAPTAPAGSEGAPTAEPQRWWQALLYDVIFNVLSPVLVPFFAVLVFWLLRKMGIKVELETLDALGLKAATYGEQKGAEWLKEKGTKSSGAQKEEWAWEFVKAVDEKFAAKEKLKNKLRAVILSKIPEASAAVPEVKVPEKPAES